MCPTLVDLLPKLPLYGNCATVFYLTIMHCASFPPLTHAFSAGYESP